jgi:hypothetical protein
MISKYWFRVAVTDAHIETVGHLPDGFTPSVYSTLLLDAVAGYLANEFRLSLLYAAMSMEVACGAVIDAQYQKIIAAQHHPAHRVVRIPTAGGQSVVKDPIFEKLKQSSSFAVKLHELPLYVIGRSILIDDQVLYNRARTLYNTRNELIHSGVVEDSHVGDLLSLDQRGSFIALETTKQILAWLDADEGISLPIFEFASLEELHTRP